MGSTGSRSRSAASSRKKSSKLKKSRGSQSSFNDIEEYGNSQQLQREVETPDTLWEYEEEEEEEEEEEYDVDEEDVEQVPEELLYQMDIQNEMLYKGKWTTLSEVLKNDPDRMVEFLRLSKEVYLKESEILLNIVESMRKDMRKFPKRYRYQMRDDPEQY